MIEVPPAAPAPKPRITQEFVSFIGHQGIVGLAVGFIFGTAISDLVSSFVSDILDPILGLVLGRGRLENAVLMFGGATISWGKFVSAVIDFLVISIVVFLMIRYLHLQKVEPRISVTRR